MAERGRGRAHVSIEAHTHHTPIWRSFVWVTALLLRALEALDTMSVCSRLGQHRGQHSEVEPYRPGVPGKECGSGVSGVAIMVLLIVSIEGIEGKAKP